MTLQDRLLRGTHGDLVKAAIEAAGVIGSLEYALRSNIALLSAFVGPDDAMGQAVLKLGRDALPSQTISPQKHDGR